ncbi:AAA family ATPase [Nostoc sp. CHAB 5844]|nr:AAA family ATPase [Nostoc sp. CHAB 5844]
MLKKLILENWKSFRYAELPLDPLTVLIGTNASGKSNVVEALEFLQRIVSGEKVESALAGDKILQSIRGGVEWAARKPETNFTLSALVNGVNDNTDYLYVMIIETQPFCKILQEFIVKYSYVEDKQENIIKKNLLISWNEKELENNYTGIDVRKKYDDYSYRVTLADTIYSQSILRQIDGILDNDENINVYDFLRDTLENVFILNPIPSTMRQYSRLSDRMESDASNIAGVLAALPDEQKFEVESTLSTYIKELPEGDIKKVWAEKVGRFGTDAMLYCQEEWKHGHITEIDVRSMSDGTLRFLAILTALLTRPEGSQIVIEEIDNGLHPSRAELLVRILREIGSKRNIDILLTTHNPALLDALGPEIVPFVVVAHRDYETGESKLTLLEDIDNFSKLFASYSLGNMATKGAIERSLSHDA